MSPETTSRDQGLAGLEEVISRGIAGPLKQCRTLKIFACMLGSMVRRVGRLTIDIIPHPTLFAFVVMHHLNDLQQIIFTQFLQSLRQLIHVDALCVRLFPLLRFICSRLSLLATTRAIDACIYRSCRSITRDWARPTKCAKKRGFGILESDDLFHLVAVVVKVEIVSDGVVFAGDIGEDHFELELTPAIFLDLEGWFSDGY
jgi:hypothetical protein